MPQLRVRIHPADGGIDDGPQMPKLFNLSIRQFNPMLSNDDGDFLRMPKRPTYRNGMRPIVARVSRRADAIPSDGQAIHFLYDRPLVFSAHELTAHADAEIESIENGGFPGIAFTVASPVGICGHALRAALDRINIKDALPIY
jgi:hypothetical protein